MRVIKIIPPATGIVGSGIGFQTPSSVPGHTYAVDIDGGYAYVADFEGALAIINVSDPYHRRDIYGN